MRWGVILAVFLVLAMSCAVEWEGRRVNGFSRRTRVGEHPETIVNAYEAVHALHRTDALRTDEDKKTAIETLITAYRNAYKIPGLGYGVVQNKQPLLSGGVGVRGHTQAADDSVNADTLFAIGSTSKAFTAALVGQLVDEHRGSWDFDTPVWSLFRESFKMMDPVASLRMTFRDMLSHGTGMPDHGHDLATVANNMTRGETSYRVRFAQPQADFRSKMLYSNLMISTAGYLAGELQGKTWEDAVVEKIFTPLGLSDTFPNWKSALNASDNYAFPFATGADGSLSKVNPLYNDVMVGPEAPAGDIVSSPNDMVQWIIANLNGGGGIVSPETLAEIHKPQRQMDGLWTSFENPLNPSSCNVSVSFDTYCMCWISEHYRSVHHTWHNGAVIGMNAQVSLAIEHGAGVVLLASRDAVNGQLTDLARGILDIVLGLEPWLAPPSAKWHDFPYFDSIEEVPLSPAPLEHLMLRAEEEPVSADDPPTSPMPIDPDAYANSYTHPFYGTIHVSTEKCNGNNSLSLVWGENSQGCLEHVGVSVFFMRFWSPLAPAQQLKTTVRFFPMLVSATVAEVYSMSVFFSENFDNVLFTTEKWENPGQGYTVGVNYNDFELDAYTPFTNAPPLLRYATPSVEPRLPALVLQDSEPHHPNERHNHDSEDSWNEVISVTLGLVAVLAISTAVFFFLAFRKLQAKYDALDKSGTTSEPIQIGGGEYHAF